MHLLRHRHVHSSMLHPTITQEELEITTESSRGVGDQVEAIAHPNTAPQGVMHDMYAALQDAHVALETVRGPYARFALSLACSWYSFTYMLIKTCTCRLKSRWTEPWPTCIMQ